MEYATPMPCDTPQADAQDAEDYPDEPRQCACGWLLTSHVGPGAVIGEDA